MKQYFPISVLHTNLDGQSPAFSGLTAQFHDGLHPRHRPFNIQVHQFRPRRNPFLLKKASTWIISRQKNGFFLLKKIVGLNYSPKKTVFFTQKKSSDRIIPEETVFFTQKNCLLELFPEKRFFLLKKNLLLELFPEKNGFFYSKKLSAWIIPRKNRFFYSKKLSAWTIPRKNGFFYSKKIVWSNYSRRNRFFYSKKSSAWIIPRKKTGFFTQKSVWLNCSPKKKTKQILPGLGRHEIMHAGYRAGIRRVRPINVLQILIHEFRQKWSERRLNKKKLVKKRSHQVHKPHVESREDRRKSHHHSSHREENGVQRFQGFPAVFLPPHRRAVVSGWIGRTSSSGDRQTWSDAARPCTIGTLRWKKSQWPKHFTTKNLTTENLTTRKSHHRKFLP